MKVILMVPDEGGCGHYRVRYPGQAASEAGVDVEFATNLNVDWTYDVEADERRPVKVNVEADLIVIQRPLRRLNADLIPVLQKQGIAVAVDIDDDLTAIDPDNLAFHRLHPSKSPENNWKHVSRACKMADLVLVTTPALKRRYGGHGRCVVLPNYVPELMLGTLPREPRDGQTIGWPGFIATHPHDLEVTRNGVAAAMRDTGARFRNIGSGDDVQRQLGLTDELEFEATGSVDFYDYPHEVASLDVGIAPLKDTAFNASKSGLKLLEMAAVGVPSIGSPRADYARLAEDGIGVLAGDRERDWRKAIKRMLGPEGREVAEQAQAAVRERHTYEGHAQDWVDAWEQAVARRAA
jgi:glycosyltransferase involved in cell wall biosynthesis